MVQLISIQKKYYAYIPSEPYFNTYLKLSDSTLTLNYFNDGCIPALLQKVKWINNKTVQIRTKSLYVEDSIVVFHFLDDSKTISVLEFPLRKNKRRFQLMVAKKNLNKFPLIVNYCPNNRCSEWNFDPPNFKSLIK